MSPKGKIDQFFPSVASSLRRFLPVFIPLPSGMILSADQEPRA